jgi:hypothetical protein
MVRLQKRLVFLLGLMLVVSVAGAEPKGKSISASGELVDMWCYYEGGDHGPQHKACSTACAKAGNPIGLLQKNGQVRPISDFGFRISDGSNRPSPIRNRKSEIRNRSVLVQHMNENVTVKGTLVSKGGVNMLYVTGVTPKK